MHKNYLGRAGAYAPGRSHRAASMPSVQGPEPPADGPTRTSGAPGRAAESPGKLLQVLGQGRPAPHHIRRLSGSRTVGGSHGAVWAFKGPLSLALPAVRDTHAPPTAHGGQRGQLMQMVIIGIFLP